jgi:glutathione S-transferase
MPFGRVPVLEVDGKKMSHTMAINRFLAQKFKIAGSNDLESYEIECAALFIYDLIGSK